MGERARDGGAKANQVRFRHGNRSISFAGLTAGRLDGGLHAQNVFELSVLNAYFPVLSAYVSTP
jgi:hypothetical protein